MALNRQERGRSLGELLERGSLVVPLRATELVDALAELWVASARQRPAGSVPEGLQGLRSTDLVPLGEHAVLAHLHEDGSSEARVALGIGAEPFPFAPGTARQARILVLLLVPSGASHQRLLAGLGRLLRRGDVAERLAAARSREEVLAEPGVSEPLVEEELQVGHVMSADVAWVTPDTPLGEVATLMARRRLRAVPVVNENREVLGIVSDREVIEHFMPLIVSAAGEGGGEEALDTPVRERMERSVMCVRTDQGLREALTLMVQKDVDRFPVVDEGALVGFLTRGDILRRLLAPRPEAARAEALETEARERTTAEGKGR